MTYQFVVICACDERKNNTKRILEKCNIPNNIIHYLNATTIKNSQSFLSNLPNDINENNLKIMCCIKSHLKALEIAYHENSPEYTIILEDDVTFYKDNIIDKFETIINKWDIDTKYRDLELIHLGWVPCNNYQKYLKQNIIDVFDENNFKMLNTFRANGLQAYMIKKSKYNSTIKEIINSENYIKFKENVHKYCSIIKKSDTINNNNIIAIDIFFSRYFRNFICFPPLAIERNEPSLLGHENQKHYWDVFFRYCQEKKNDYL